MSFSKRHQNFKFFAQSLILLLFLVISSSVSLAEQSESRSLMMPLAAKSLILDLATAGNRIVAVGWRGHILISDDNGSSWKQINSPTREMLTSVYFSDDLHGWAVGHGTTILSTVDGGKSWKLLHTAPEEEQPLFDVVVNGDYGFAIGAYAKFMVTTDGGKSWGNGEFTIQQDETATKNPDDEEPLPFDYHLNRISLSNDGTFYIAAEAGFIFRSDDGGHSWKELPSIYEGSYFGILVLDNQTLLGYCLRGNLFRSEDSGQNWEQIQTGITVLLTDAIKLKNGTIVVTGMAGAILTSRDNGKSFTLSQSNRIPWTSAVETATGSLILAGERGAKVYDVTDLIK